MAAPGLTIDHVTVAGRDLGRMRLALESAGLKTEYGGAHANRATEMALTSFPDGSYLELIALQPHADAAAVAAHPWRAFLQSDAGPCAWAVRAPDLDVQSRRLQAAGIAVAAPLRNGRQRPDGVRLEWETARAGPGADGALFPFLIRDFTRRDLRAFPSGRPTTTVFAGIAAVVIAAMDLDAAIGEYRRAYGLPEPQWRDDPEFGGKLAWFDGAPVALTRRSDDARNDLGNAPCAFVLQRGNAQRRGAGAKVTWFDAGKLGWRLGWE